MKKQFRQFLITEERVYLSTKIGDILTAIQQLSHDASNMGKRHLIRLIKNIVRQIRRVLHSSWAFEEESYLKVLQKVGVALMKGLDDNEDLPTLIQSCADEMQKLSDKVGEPVNNLASPAVDRDDD
jgi:hypothetical protein